MAELVASVLPELPGGGVLEVVRDRRLTSRTEAERAATSSPVADRVELQTWSGPFGNIAYALATRTA